MKDIFQNGKYYTVKEVIERLKVSETTIHRWKTKGKIELYMVNGRLMISGEELNKNVVEKRSK